MTVRTTVQVVLVSAITALTVFGCDRLATATNKPEVTEAVEHSVSVLTCAPQVMAMVADQARRQLPYGAALAFCAAIEASPTIVPPSTATNVGLQAI